MVSYSNQRIWLVLPRSWRWHNYYSTTCPDPPSCERLVRETKPYTLRLQLKVSYTRIRCKYCIALLESTTPAIAHTWKAHHWLSVSVLYHKVDQYYYRCDQWNPNIYLLIAAILHLACAHPCVFLNCLNSTKTQVQLIRYTCVFYVKCIQCRIMSGLLG